MKRVLFVDDDQAVLDGLRRSLRARRGQWDMRFVSAPDEALRQLAAEPIDVVVSDLRMPGMDGARFLAQVQQLSPRTVRLFLSSEVGLEAALRGVCISHQFLTKPCDADTLQSVIERSCALEELLHDERLQGVLGEVGDLPALPKTFRALAQALAEPEVDLRAVSAIVEQDQAIAVKLLHVVNSSYFGLRNEISSIHQATSYLGANMVRDLVLSAEIARQFEGGDAPAGFSLARLQEHGLLTSRIARRLLVDKRLADQAFLAGMLHDVGKLVLAGHLPAQMRALLAAGAGRTHGFHALETQLGLVGHAALGAYLLALWGMPYPIVDAVAHHHEREQVAARGEFGVLAAVHVADALAEEAAGQLDRRPDEELLGLLGVQARLPEWRALAAAEHLQARRAA